jgi:hypothetical protein
MSTQVSDRPAGRGQRVRLLLRKAAICTFIVLLPIGIHALWDFIELRRLIREIERIQAIGEPVSVRNSGAPSRNEGKAGSYYLAASLLTLGVRPRTVIAPFLEGLADRTSDMSPLLKRAEPLQQLVADSERALSLADYASEVDFTGFPAGTEYNYRTAGLAALSGVLTARTLSLSASGQGEKAVISAISGLRVRRAFRDTGWPYAGNDEIGALLSLCQPSAEALRRLQLELEQEQRLADPAAILLRQRADYIEALWHRYYGVSPLMPRTYYLPMRSLIETFARPWITHQAVATLNLWAELIHVARLPWPQRAQASTALLERYRDQPRPIGSLAIFVNGGSLPIALFSQAMFADAAVVDDSSRVALAIERYRRDHQGRLPSQLPDLSPAYVADIPIDPFSGSPLLFRERPGSYVVYSVGPDRRDDGGEVNLGHQGAGGTRSADVGVKVITNR